MPIEILVPRLGWSMDEGTFVEWLKGDGEYVSAGDMLFVLEGEKASQEIESFDEGILHIPDDAPRRDETVMVGQRLAYLLIEGESPPAQSQHEPTALAAGCETVAKPRAEPEASADGSQDRLQPTDFVQRSGTRAVASPRARRAASELGVEWTDISGSGRSGRVRERDVIRAASMKSSPAEGLPKTRGTLQPPSKIRRAIAQRMISTVQQTAPVTLTTKIDGSALSVFLILKA